MTEGRARARVRAVVVDDEPDAREVVLTLLEAHPEVQVVGEANNGRRLILTPEASGSLWSTYRLPVGDGLSVGGGVRFTGSSFINAANTIKLPAFHVVDALAEYPVNAHLSLRLNVYNLTDERYIRSINNNGGRYNPGYPRSAAQ